MIKTTAGKRLRRWICGQGMRQQDFAALIGCSGATVCCLISGTYAPKLHTAMKIQAATGIPLADWLDEEQRQRIERLGQ
jgi:transcriptional regulator with XRE-family HTH domain